MDVVWQDDSGDDFKRGFGFGLVNGFAEAGDVVRMLEEGAR